MSTQYWIALGLLGLLGGGAWMLWQRRAHRATRPLDALDTVAAWPPQSTRLLSLPERAAYQALRAALPEHLVMAQVPLARFLAVPRRNSYSEWLRRVGHLSVDLLVCDAGSHALAVVAIENPSRDNERSLRRRERMARVLRGAGVRMAVWKEGNVPDAETIRSWVRGQDNAAAAPAPAPALAALAALVPDAPDTTPLPEREPPPSTWFDDLDTDNPPQTLDKR
jgi:hypothetical protein